MIIEFVGYSGSGKTSLVEAIDRIDSRYFDIEKYWSKITKIKRMFYRLLNMVDLNFLNFYLKIKNSLSLSLGLKLKDI